MANVAQLGRCGILALAVLLAACGEGGEDEAGKVPATNANSAPTIAGNPTKAVAPGASYMFAPSALDTDGDSLVFGINGMPAWASFDATSGRLTGTPGAADVGTYHITIWVSDGDVQSALPEFDVTVDAPVAPNRAPTISGTPAASAVVGGGYAFTPTASDPDGNALTFSISKRPVWATFNTSTGRLSGTPQASNVGTFTNIVITVSDGEDTAALPAFTITVAPRAVNGPPVISGVPTTTVEAGKSYAFVPTASDPDGDTLTFSASGLPSWAGFDLRTGRIAGTPPSTATGTTGNIVLRVTDGKATVTLPTFSITVLAPTNNIPPTISGAPSSSATDGEAYTFQPTATDADGDALTFSIANRPSWATFNSNTGRLQGTPGPSNIVTYGNIVISVSDGKAATALPAFSITVAAGNAAPSISGTPSTAATVGTQYTFTPAANDANGDTLTFSITNKPAWATFTASNGRLRGTPAAGNVGTTSGVVISVSDGEVSASLPAFSITVNAVPNRAPTIAGTPTTAVTAGSQYSFTPTANDADSNTLTFSIANKPAWATFTASSGRLQGSPVAGDVGTTSGIVISVSDGKVSAALAAFAISVTTVPNRAPTITGTPATSVMTGSQYSFQPSASDADGDTLTFAIANKPSWATFNTGTGRLQGTPAAGDVGTTSGIVISVSDGKASTARAAFNVTVVAVATGSATLTWAPPTQNTDGSALTIAGYKVYWGTSAGSYSNSVTLNNPGLTSYVVDGLVPGTYFFSATAFNSTGTESSLSNSATKTIQ